MKFGGMAPSQSVNALAPSHHDALKKKKKKDSTEKLQYGLSRTILHMEVGVTVHCPSRLLFICLRTKES